MIYLAQPYSDPDPLVRHGRYLAGLEACAHYTSRFPYSPVVHWHNVAESFNLPGDFEHWRELNFHFLARSKAIYVLRLDGWQDSLGLAAELMFARRLNISIGLVFPETYDLWFVTPNKILSEMTHANDTTEFLDYPRDVEGDES